jgi:hypothetical protein
MLGLRDIVGSTQNTQNLGVSILDAHHRSRDSTSHFFPPTPCLVQSVSIELPVSTTIASGEVEADATRVELGGSYSRSSRRRGSADMSTSHEDLIFQPASGSADEDLIFQLAHCASGPSNVTTVSNCDTNTRWTRDDRCSSTTFDTGITDSCLEPGDHKLMEALAAECCGGKVVQQNSFVTGSHDSSDLDSIQSNGACCVEEQDFLLRSFSDSHGGMALEENWCV